MKANILDSAHWKEMGAPAALKIIPHRKKMMTMMRMAKILEIRALRPSDGLVWAKAIMLQSRPVILKEVGVP